MPSQMRARIEGERIAGDDLEPARIMRGDFLERGDSALIAFDGDHAGRALRQQRARQSARSGADLDNRYAGKRSAGARDARRQIKIEQEILAERLLGGEAMPADDLAQRRQVVDLGHLNHPLVPAKAATHGVSF